jgi:hypothetical protein
VSIFRIFCSARVREAWHVKPAMEPVNIIAPPVTQNTGVAIAMGQASWIARNAKAVAIKTPIFCHR